MEMIGDEKNMNTISGRRTLGVGSGVSGERREWAGTLSGAETAGGGGSVVLAGRYRVVRRLGEGGMGSVWLAEDLKLDGKRFAIKMLPAVLAGKKGAYRQVKAEAMVAMKLAHPNIATVRAFEEDEGGNPFLVMDYIEGEGLDEILAERGPLGAEETLRLLGPVAAALDYAHSKGVVHRDVKPGNVIVAKDGTPFVLDFGIAREIQETLTRVTGKLSSGTLLYMSPEQLNGARPQATQDVYSFAAMAYECLAGEPPFCRGAIEDQIKNKTPEALPEDVGEALRAGIMAGLAKGPEGRPGSCAAVLGSKVEGQWSKVWEDEGKGNNENRFADSEKVGGAQKEEREDEDVFLQKVRLRREYDEAVRKAATPEDREALEKIRELFVAGGEALRVGDKKVAGRLFGQMEASLMGWRKNLVEREERERKAKEEQERVRREAAEAQERARREDEARRQAQRRAALLAVEWRQAESKARDQRAIRRVVFTVLTLLVLGMALMLGGLVIWQSDREVTGRKSLSLDLGKGVALEMMCCPEVAQNFWMGKCEVTQEQWQRVMGENPSEFAGKPKNPVENVTWAACKEFVKRINALPSKERCGLTFRLPTMEEWEMACRAGAPKETDYCKLKGGTQIMGSSLYLVARYGKGRNDGPVAVRHFSPNAWGLHDMHGNVWEWTDTADGAKHWYMGGGFNSAMGNCTAHSRYSDTTNASFYNLGLRLAAVGKGATQ